MVVIGRGEGEFLHTSAFVGGDREAQAPRYADRETVLRLASEIANDNSELMRRLA